MNLTPPRGFDGDQPSADDLIWAYRHGVFPMAVGPTGRVEWFCPDPRAILPLDRFRVPASLARRTRSGRFDIRADTALEQVMRQCAQPRSARNGTWMSPPLLAAYLELHERGSTHSIEAWREGTLVGGLYGVHIGSVFFGESMFSRPSRGGTDSSRVCLVHLVQWLRCRGIRLLDVQFMSEHLRQFGAEEVTRGAFLTELARAIAQPASWGTFEDTLSRSSRPPS